MMTKLVSSGVVIQPYVVEPSARLVFKGSLTREVTACIRINNWTQNGILFKVKTTAVACYCVKPSRGHLSAGEEVMSIVTTKPTEISVEDRRQHMFLVQTLVAPEDYAEEHFEDVWSCATKDQISVSEKLRCVFTTEIPIPMEDTANQLPAVRRGPINAMKKALKVHVEEQKLCTVCLDRDRDTILMPCCHLCVCSECSISLNTCPLCRKEILSKHKVYY